MNLEQRIARPEEARGIEVRVFRTVEDFQSLRADWEELYARRPRRNPFLTFEWADAWLRVFGREVDIRTIRVRADDSALAIAPLCRRGNGDLTFIGYPQSDYSDILIGDRAEEAVDAVLSELAKMKDWRRVVLDQLPSEQSELGLLVSRLNEGDWSFLLEHSDPCPAMTLEDLEAARRLYDKRNIRTYTNWYRKQGSLRHAIYADPDSGSSHLEQLFTQHIERWQGTATPSYFRDERMRAFYRTFFAPMAREGWARLAVLELEEEVLATYLFFIMDNTMSMYKTSYNRSYMSRSPGQVILKVLFDYAAENGVREIDFGRGDEGYKDRFSNLIRQNERLILYRGSAARRRAMILRQVQRSRIVDLVYRNRWVQSVKWEVLRRLRDR